MIKRILTIFENKKEDPFSEFDNYQKKRIIKKIKKLVGSYPKNYNYFIKAFTHRSYLEKISVENKSNERLEFLGDAILGKIVAEYLFKKYPNEAEGFLTKARSHLVNKHSLEKIGFELKLNELLFINDNYISKDKKKLSNIVADCVEALIGAIYLDMGMIAVNKFIVKNIITPQVLNGDINYDNNYKGQLLEYSHANKLNQPVYEIIEQSGPQHDKVYTIKVTVNDKIKGVGKGPNKKIAEQKAAQQALTLAEELQY